jgi:peptidoglycan/xylan/chitin deacetylase (PgdA/CDA1 family)
LLDAVNRPRWIHTRSFQRLKNLFFAMLFYIGLFDLVRAISNKLERGAVILCYHRVVESDPDRYSIPGTQVDLRSFTTQVGGLSRKYRIIPFAVLVEKLKKGLLDPDQLVLSFDDGFKDNRCVAYPVLRRHHATGIFFISPEMIGSRSLLWNNRVWFLLNCPTQSNPLHWGDLELPLESESERLRARDLINQTLASMKEEDREAVFEQIADALRSPLRPSEKPEIMLSREDISDMVAGGLAEFGSHSLTHPLLPLCNEEQRTLEVQGSRKALEQVLDRPVAYFAYPGGAYDEKTVQSVRNAGYEAAVTTSEGLVRAGDDLFFLHRVNVVRDDTLYSLMVRKLAPLYLRNIVLTLKKRIHVDSRD